MPVSVVKADYLNIQRKLKKALDLIGYRPRADRVLFKPNAASAYGHYLLGDYTSPQLIEAFIRLFPDREYVIAEGAAVGMSFMDAARMLGYTALEKKYKTVRVVNLENEPRVELEWKFGKIRIPRIVRDSEYVNMPKMKTHALCTVTLGMKNQKGLLDEGTKKQFHWMDIHAAIRELADKVRPALTIVDALVALEGNGPNSLTARPKWMGLLVAGTDLIEVDNACLELMGVPEGLAAHVPRVTPRILGERVAAVSKRFKLPEMKHHMVKSGNIYFGLGGCSGCPESLSGGVREMFAPAALTHLPPRLVMLARVVAGPTFIYIGKHAKLASSGGQHICLGNCTRKFAEENDLPFIPGCPPPPEAIHKAFDEMRERSV